MDADYAALQLRRGASAAEVRASFLSLSRRHHPDRGGDAALFRRHATPSVMGYVEETSTVLKRLTMARVLLPPPPNRSLPPLPRRVCAHYPR